MNDKCYISCSIIKTESQDLIENKERLCLKPRIPRPPNAFMLYANENRKIMSQQYPTESNKDISKKLGSSWRSLNQEEKNRYFEKAHNIDLEHKKKYPDYVYNPKEARIRKAMREAASRDNRDRLGSPMLARPNARRAPPSHAWTPAQTHDDLMMSNMRNNLESSCYIPTATATTPVPGQFQNAGYMQPNPLTQLHQPPDLWHGYPEEMRSRSSGNPFMMPPDHAYHQPRPFHLPLATPPRPNDDVTPPREGEWLVGVADDGGEGPAGYGEELREISRPPTKKRATPSTATPTLTTPPLTTTPTLTTPPMTTPTLTTAPTLIAPTPTLIAPPKRPPTKSLPDFNEAFGSTERGRFQSPPDPRLGPNKGGYLDLFYEEECGSAVAAIKFDDFQI